LRLDLVQGVITPHQQHVQLVVVHHQHRFDCLLQIDLQQRCDVLAGFLSRCGDLLHLFLRRAARARRHRFGELDVGGVVRLRAERDRVLA